MTFQRLRDKSMPRPEKRPQDSQQECSLSLLCFHRSSSFFKSLIPFLSCSLCAFLWACHQVPSLSLISSLPLLPPLLLFCGASQMLHWYLQQMEWAAACPSQDRVPLATFSSKCPWLVKIRWRSHKKEEAYPWLGSQKLGPNGCAHKAGGCSPALSAATPESSTQPSAASVTSA